MKSVVACAPDAMHDRGMRLPLLPPDSLSPDQQDLYDDMVAAVEKNFGELVARRDDDALIGPFNA
jgi:4-carboxymuconolactone decarboxylase